MERVTDQEQTVEIFENDIDFYLHEFCESQEIQNMKSESQSVWNSCLRYIYKHVFKNTDVLKTKNIISASDAYIPTTYNSYDYNLVLDVLDIYIHDMCMRYDKEVSIIGFSILTGIDESVIYDWGNGSTKLSSVSAKIYKKLHDFREESLSNKLVTGRQNPVGVLGVLNRHYQWNMPGVGKETAKKRVLSISELPKLSGEIIQIEQNDVE